MRRFHSLAPFVLLAPLGLPLAIGGLGEEGVGPGLDGSAASPESRASTAPATTDIPAGLSHSDWAGIRAAHEVERYSVREVDGELQARNPGQRWTTRFDGRGFLVEPDAGGWEWGLELASYGFADREVTLTKPRTVNAEGGRVAYAWDDTIEEWYLNDGRGLEHGYTMARRPESGGDNDEDEPLTITLAVRGGLRATVDTDGHGVHFVNSAGSKTVTYTGLKVVDVDGRMLPATFRAANTALVLSIDVDDARYPLTIDPVAQQAYLKASNTDPGDRFGYSAAASGNTVVVGAYYESSNATGVNGNQINNDGWRSGAAYVFVWNGATWIQQAYLKASNTGNQDWFGYSVSISGDTILVGAWGEDSDATGVNGDQHNEAAYQSGAAYVFVRNGAAWSQQAYLKASNTEAWDDFGKAVAVFGDTAVIGADTEDSGAPGINGNQDDNTMTAAGAAYVFVRNGTTWSQQAYIKASNPNQADYFGRVVAVSGDVMVIGAPWEASSAVGINGDQRDNSMPGAGAAYVFARTGTTWSQQAYLKASNTDPDDLFGYGVSIDSTTIVVGAAQEESSATGVNGNQIDNSANNAGAAYVFFWDGSSWSQQAYLKASNTDPSDVFGVHVSARGDLVLVAATGESSVATGIDGDQLDNSAPDAGAAYIFARNGASWSQQAYLKASNAQAADFFGSSVSLSESVMAIGAHAEDSGATGVNGSQVDNSAFGSGAAYLYDMQAPGIAYCSGGQGSGIACPCGNENDASQPGAGCANGVFASGALLTGYGLASVSADTFVLSTMHLEPSNSGLYFQGTTNLSPGLPWGDGLRCTGGAIRRLQVRFSDSTGLSNTTIPLADKGNVNPGDTCYYQCWYRNPLGSPCGFEFNTSNGYTVKWTP